MIRARPHDPSRPGRHRLIRRATLVALVLALLGAGFALWPHLPSGGVDLTWVYDQVALIRDWRDRNTALAALVFVLIFGVAGTLPLPVVTVMSLAGGAMFGLWAGALLSVAGTTLSATLSFLIARHLIYRPLRRRLGRRAQALDRTVARDGWIALLSLRLTPALPFLIINLAAGISRMRLAVFVPITAIGVLPNKTILALAGTSLAEIDNVSDIFGPRLIAALIALALLPWLARWLLRRARRSASKR